MKIPYNQTVKTSDLIYKLESLGFKVKGNKIEKYSRTARRFEVAGQINEAGVYFYAQNVPPFIQGQNSYKDIFNDVGNIDYSHITTAIKEDVTDRLFSFDEYIDNTKEKNQFLLFIKNLNKTFTHNDYFKNEYDLRGVIGGSFEDATLFPYINYNGQFQTAKIVKYNSKTGKRLKNDYSNSWFHAERTIKKRLGITEKISKPTNCFFGEHLLKDCTKPVGIVEAEKTASILNLLFKNIRFIATGGVGKLRNLEYYFLHDRQVFLFPDKDALEWHKIAKERNWYCSEVLENIGFKPGEDIADYVIPYINNSFDEGCDVVWWKLFDELIQIEKQEAVTNKNENNGLGFSHKHNKDFNKLALAIPEGRSCIKYTDKSKGFSLRCNYFTVYENKFQVLNANINFNKLKKDKGKFRSVTEEEFIYRLEKVYRIIKYLNKDYTNHLEEYEYILYNIAVNSNFNFNVKYVLNVLVKEWDKTNIDVWNKYGKTRNWVFSGGEALANDEFRKKLDEDKAMFRTHEKLIEVKKLILKNEFVTPDAVGLKRRENLPFVWDLIREYHLTAFGSTKKKQYLNTLEVNEYLGLQRNLYTSYSSNIECTKTVTTFEESVFYPSVNIISQNTSVSRLSVKKILEHKKDANAITDILFKITSLLRNHKNISFKREEINGRKCIIVEPIYIEEATEAEIPLMAPKDAISYELELNNSVLNCSEETAINKDISFYISWKLFNNPEADETERYYIEQNTADYYNKRLRTAILN